MNSCGCCKLEYTNEDGHTPEECANRLSDKVQQLLLQNEDLQKKYLNAISNGASAIEMFNEERERRIVADRLNGGMLAALIALADRVSVRFGEVIKYEPVATGRYLDAAYEIIGKAKATEKPKCECQCRAPHCDCCEVHARPSDSTEKRNDEQQKKDNRCSTCGGSGLMPGWDSHLDRRCKSPGVCDLCKGTLERGGFPCPMCTGPSKCRSSFGTLGNGIPCDLPEGHAMPHKAESPSNDPDVEWNS